MSIPEALAALVLAVSVSAWGPAAAAGPGRTTTPASGSPALPTDPAQGAWPLQPRPHVERAFDPPDQPWLAGHRGVDLTARVGQPVLAPTGGRVSFSGPVAGRGVVVVTHADGLRSSFEPVTAALLVGEVVTQGQPVGLVAEAAGHCAPATCLHWGVRRADIYLDPLSLLRRVPLVLLALH